MNELIIKHSNLSDYTRAFNSMSHKEQEDEFENIGGLWAKQSPKYGPVVYSSNVKNEIPRKKQVEWGILKDGINLGNKGADWWADTTSGPVALECKYQHEEQSLSQEKKKSLGMHKFGDKDKFLQSTNAVEKVMITSADRTSRHVQVYAEDWILISGDMIFEPLVYKRMRQVALAEKQNQLAAFVKPKIISYRPSEAGPDMGSDAFHKDTMKDGHTDVINQITQHGNARSLWKKPTAAGKGYDPILYWKDFLSPYLIAQNPKQNVFITCTVSPQLTVLNGNTEKQLEQIDATGSNVRVRILASSRNRDDKDELNALKSKAVVINKFDLDDEIEKALKSKTHTHFHIETTVHSYYKLADILRSKKITGDFLYIDEVKNTTQEEDSDHAMCLFDNHAVWLVRIGADANTVEHTDTRGNQTPTSMGNTELWRTTGVEWQEIDATSRGWKRWTEPGVGMFDIRNLHPSILSLVSQQKNGVMIKDNGFTVNLEWRLHLEVLAKRLVQCDRRFPLLKVNSLERAKLFEQYATKVWPEIINSLPGDARRPEVKRLLNMPFLSIYRAGNSHNKILSFVESIPTDYKNGAFVIQVKKLNEGWDPTDGWVDYIGFVDASGSRTLISQLVGRGARNDPARKYKGLPVLMIKVVDSENEYSIPYAFREIEGVCHSLGAGNNIDDSLTIFDYTNKGRPGSIKSRGSKSYRGIYTQGGWNNAYVGFKRNGRYNPYASVVEDVYHTYKDVWYDAYNDNLKRQNLNQEIIENEKFVEFFSQYKDETTRRGKVSHIMKGMHFLMRYEFQKEARTKYQKSIGNYRQDVRGSAYNWLIETRDAITQAKLGDYLGLADKAIVSQLILQVRKTTKVLEKREMSYASQTINVRLLRMYPTTGKILETLFRNALDEFINNVRELENEINNDYMDLQKKTTSNSANGTMAGILKRIVANKYGLIPDIEKVVNNLKGENVNRKVKSSLTKEELEITYKKNIKIAMSIYENIHYNETLSDKFANVTERNTRFIEECENQGLIVNLVASPVHTVINPNMSKEFRKEHDAYWNIVNAKNAVADRKEYVNGVAKPFIADGKEYPSKPHADRDLRLDSVHKRPLDALLNFRPDLYYYKETGPGTPIKVQFIVTPHGEVSTVQDAFKLDLENKRITTSGSWWANRVKNYPEEYYTDTRIPTQEEVLTGKARNYGTGTSRRTKCNKEVA